MDEINTHAALKSLKHKNLTWVDTENPSQEVLGELEHEYHLHPIHVKESLQKVQHTQVEREEQYLFLVLHVPIFNKRSDKILVSQIGVFLGKDFLITIRSAASPPITDLFDLCHHDSAKGEEYFRHGLGYVLYILIHDLLADISALTDDVVNELDEIEDLVFDNNGSDAQRIGKVRQQIVRLRRIIGPKRLLLQDLAEQIDSFTGQSMAKYYSNNTKTVNRLWEVIEEAKETVEIYKDADFTTSTEQTNKILAILTILFTFTIPVTVIGTLYGMNVPMPGSIEAGPWTFLGRYTTFEILAAASLVMAIGMYLYFRRKKWF